MINGSPPPPAVNRISRRLEPAATRQTGSGPRRAILAGIVAAISSAGAHLARAEDNVGPDPKPAEEEGPEGQAAASAEAASEFRALLEELEEASPDRDRVAENHERIAGRLEGFIQAHPGAPETGRARALLGEVRRVGGDLRRARKAWEELSQLGPRDADRAHGLYLLGDHYYLARGAGERRLALAEAYFGQLVSRYPDSPWAERAARPVRYLSLKRGGRSPEFRETFRLGDRDVHVDSKELRGRLVLLDFWRSDTPGQREFETTLARDLRASLESYPDLRGRVEVLGVNLDEERPVQERAVRLWDIPWPQFHDGRGFESSLARAFGIPRVPHLVVIDPEGTIRYLGPDRDAFFAAATKELRALRQGGSGDPSEEGESG